MTDKDTGGDERLRKADSVARGERASADDARVLTDGTVLTLEERRRLIRSEWSSDVLPSVPPKPGWHYCWLSTTNSSDPIYRRMQKGYEPVKIEEIPGFQQYKVTEGEFEGCVACNEMLLFKLPEELYQEAMRYFHHELPAGEEELLEANAKKILEMADSSGRSLAEIQGFDGIVRRVRPSTFE